MNRHGRVRASVDITARHDHFGARHGALACVAAILDAWALSLAALRLRFSLRLRLTLLLRLRRRRLAPRLGSFATAAALLS
jgi:hypothetical protein